MIELRWEIVRIWDLKLELCKREGIRGKLL